MLLLADRTPFVGKRGVLERLAPVVPLGQIINLTNPFGLKFVRVECNSFRRSTRASAPFSVFVKIVGLKWIPTKYQQAFLVFDLLCPSLAKVKYMYLDLVNLSDVMEFQSRLTTLGKWAMARFQLRFKCVTITWTFPDIFSVIIIKPKRPEFMAAIEVSLSVKPVGI
jgi:hypothetical protein